MSPLLRLLLAGQSLSITLSVETAALGLLFGEQILIHLGDQGVDVVVDGLTCPDTLSMAHGSDVLLVGTLFESSVADHARVVLSSWHGCLYFLSHLLFLILPLLTHLQATILEVLEVLRVVIVHVKVGEKGNICGYI